ncbi:MAG: hypothetical protein IJB27_00005, partial [Clostridia bacterium]|nr:hypothetical protein [Clostridia bacterium]
TPTTTSTTTTTVQSMGNLVTFSVGSATGSIGDTIVIPVSVSENHYMVNGQIFVHYDPEVLEIQPVWDDEDNPYFEDYNNKIFTNKYMWAFNGDDVGVAKFAFAASASKGTTVGGEMYALTFKIVGEAPEGSAITVEIPEMCSCDGVTNGTEDYNTNFTTVNGLVTVN